MQELRGGRVCAVTVAVKKEENKMVVLQGRSGGVWRVRRVVHGHVVECVLH